MRQKPKVGSDIIFFSADVAQLVEQLIRNEKVDSSIPFIGTMVFSIKTYSKSQYLDDIESPYLDENWLSNF